MLLLWLMEHKNEECMKFKCLDLNCIINCECLVLEKSIKCVVKLIAIFASNGSQSWVPWCHGKIVMKDGRSLSYTMMLQNSLDIRGNSKFWNLSDFLELGYISQTVSQSNLCRFLQNYETHFFVTPTFQSMQEAIKMKRRKRQRKSGF